MINCNYVLKNKNSICEGNFVYNNQNWEIFEEINLLQCDQPLRKQEYIVPFRPLDIHCHGVSSFDFTEIKTLNLDDIERSLQKTNTNCVLTLYLPKPYFNDFIVLMNAFAEGKKQGKYDHIIGMALEGPLLSSHGGTPAQSVWYPSREEWEILANCGKKGLLYVILSPDIYLKNILKMEDMLWIVSTLLEGGVYPAPGHFLKVNPEESARGVTKMLELIEKKGNKPTISDHLFNDMPRNFKHSWRTPDERYYRSEHLKEINLLSWNKNNLEEKAGPVPAALMRGALDGLIKLCLNFDGEHVDLEISKRTVEILGVNNLIAMTDRIESRRLGGQQLRQYNHSKLLYQEQNIVAAGSQPISEQMNNMRRVGLSEVDIWTMFAFVPYETFKIKPAVDDKNRPLQYTVVDNRNVA
jgi:N-acetylglucosamine-6-phosphate deacetylase